MVRALIGVFIVVALTACGGGEDGDALPSTPSPSATKSAPPTTSPPATPTATRPSRSKKKVTGDICEKIKATVKAARRGDGTLARGGAAFTLLELQAARPDLDKDLVKIYDKNQEQPGKALSLIADWCEENGY